MNNPDAAVEQIDETATPGAEPDLSLNPHQGHLVPPEGDEDKPDDEPKTDAKEADSPSDSEGDTDKKEPDENADRKLERKLGELAFENRQLKRRLEQQPQPGEPDADEPLKALKDFDYDEAAFNGYLVDEITSRAEKRLEQRSTANSQQTAAERQQVEFEVREEVFEAENPGFKERLHADDLMITREMASFITDPDSEVGLHVGDYLASNKAEAARIAVLTPTAQAREMTKLETKIGKEVAKAKAEKTKASNAPPPPSTVDGLDPGLKVSPTDPATADKMSDEAWLKARNKQLSK